MSAFGTWKCPKCSKRWTGSIPWQEITFCSEDKINDVIVKYCGCSPKKDDEFPYVFSKIIDKR